MTQTKISTITESNKRIANNSIHMSIRMVIVLIISLYTTRCILDVLGIQDYGIYNVVCGFVSMFSFLNTSMSNGIQRFYNFELGRNGEVGANKVYNNAFLIQFLLVIIVVVLTESVGMWYLHNKMVIPSDRIFAAQCIFQLSLISFIFVIMQAPYTAAVMAHEKMSFYAIINVVDVALKLCIVLLIPLFSGDSLIIYGFLYVLISAFNFVIYYLYSKKKFKEIQLNLKFDKALFLSMLGFSGWNIFGSLSGVLKEQGINLVLNLFFGPIVNAARGIAYQLNAGLQSFVSNITMPVRPQVIQSYAKGEYDRTINLTFAVSKLSCCFLYSCALPVILEIDYILHLWLGNSIPEHTKVFVIIIILTSFVNNLNSAVSGVIHASGKMFVYQTVSSSISIMCIPSSYLGLKCGFPPEFALIMVLFWAALSQCASLVIMKNIISYSIIEYVKKIILPMGLMVIVTIWPVLIIKSLFDSDTIRFFFVLVSSIFSSVLGIYYLVLDKSEKEFVSCFISNIRHKWQK